MASRIDDCFARLREEKRKGFIAYICAGDPILKRTVDLAFALEKAGADVLELGLPFSDPLADGIVNQLAAQRSLAAGTTVRGVVDCVREIRRKSQIPIVLYSYLNPIFQFGAGKFHREAQDAGVDGLLILDLPPEEDGGDVAAGGIATGNILHIPTQKMPVSMDCSFSIFRQRKMSILALAISFTFDWSRRPLRLIG